MENQHRHIKGYRELTTEEIELMNKIKLAGANLLTLQGQLVCLLTESTEAKCKAAHNPTSTDVDSDEWSRFQGAEPFRWAAIGKTDIQTGIMALVRAVAQPAI